MDARAIRFPAAAFDHVAAMHIMSVVPEPDRVLDEIARVCRPGGSVLIANHFAGRAEGWSKMERLAAPLALLAAGVVCIDVDVFRSGEGAPAPRLILGVLGAVLALACWTVYAVWNARRLAATPNFNSHEWSLLTGVVTGALSLVLIVPAFLVGGAGHGAGAWTLFWGVSLAVALGASVIGNGLWNAASRLLPLSLSGQLIVFETLFALLYGFLHEGRWPRPLESAAIALMLAGVLWSVSLHRPGAVVDNMTAT